MSGAKILYGKDVVFSNQLCVAVEDRPKVMEKIKQMGKKISTAVLQD